MQLLIIGGSDAGIEVGLRAGELACEVEVTLLVADRYPNYSVCGIPYYLAGEVADWRDLARRSRAELDAAGPDLGLGAVRPDLAAKQVECIDAAGTSRRFGHDQLVVATGALPARPPIRRLGPLPGRALPGSRRQVISLRFTGTRYAPAGNAEGGRDPPVVARTVEVDWPAQTTLDQAIVALLKLRRGDVPGDATLDQAAVLIPYGGSGCQARGLVSLTWAGCRPRLAGGEGRLVAP